MKTNHPKFKWFVDALLFVGFLVACWLELTGVELHQWLGLAVGAFALYHLVAHLAWVKGGASRFFGKTSGQARRFMLLDALLFLGLSSILLTGLIISTWLGLQLGSYSAWFTLHVLASIGTLGLLIVKIGMHWRWIVDVTKRYIVPPAALAVQTPEPVRVKNGPSRREMLKLMGVVCVASLFPLFNALDALAQGEAQVTASNSAAQPTVVSEVNNNNARTIPNNNSTTQTVPSTTCQVRCNRRCSYPGRCRKYTDGNGNGRCDLGECV
jgi:hypothetical protein